MSTMKDYIGEIESWIEQVRDEELGVENYDFIDRLVHNGEDGNNGLAQVGAYLAIYKEDGELRVDEELVDHLDSRQGELPQGGANRFSNIVCEGDTRKRKGKTLLDREVDGHKRLYDMLEAAEQEFGDLSNMESPRAKMPDGGTGRTNKAASNNKPPQGDNNMTDQEYNAIEHALSTAVSNHSDYTKEQLHGVARLERHDVDVVDELVDNLEEYREEGMTTMQAVQGYLDQQADGNLEAIDDHIEKLYQKVDSIDISDRGNLSGEVVDTIEGITGNSYTT